MTMIRPHRENDEVQDGMLQEMRWADGTEDQDYRGQGVGRQAKKEQSKSEI